MKWHDNWWLCEHCWDGFRTDITNPEQTYYLNGLQVCRNCFLNYEDWYIMVKTKGDVK